MDESSLVSIFALQDFKPVHIAEKSNWWGCGVTNHHEKLCGKQKQASSEGLLHKISQTQS